MPGVVACRNSFGSETQIHFENNYGRHSFRNMQAIVALKASTNILDSQELQYAPPPFPSWCSHPTTMQQEPKP